MSVPQIRSEFQVHKLNEQGFAKAEDLAFIFSSFLDAIEDLGVTGRELALVTTKLQEASYFAKRSIAIDKGNQE